MARIKLSPLADEVSGRHAGLLFRQTPSGPVLQKMHAMSDAPSAPTLAAQARFRIANQSWSRMPVAMRAALASLQKTANLGTPGPWVRAFLTYLGGGDWSYPLVPDPSLDLTIASVWRGDPDIGVNLVHEFPPFPHVVRSYVFDSPATDYVTFWDQDTRAAPKLLYIAAPPEALNLHVVIIPGHADLPDYFGQGHAHAIPDP